VTVSNRVRNQFVRDIFSVVLSRISIMIIGFVGSAILARFLGPTNKGIVTTILVIPNILITFAELGVRQSATYCLGKRLYVDRDVISTIALLTLCTSILGSIIVLSSYIIGGFQKDYGWSILILAIMLVPLKISLSYSNGIILGKKQIHIYTRGSLIITFSYLIILSILVGSRSIEPKTAVIAELIACFVGVVYILIHVKGYGAIRIRYIQGLPQRFLRLGFAYALALFILNLNYDVDIVLLERISTSHEVGIYSIGVSFAELLWLVPTALSMVNFVHSASADDPVAHTQRTVRILRLVLWIALPLMGLSYLSAPLIIPLIFGEAYQDSSAVVRAILPGIWISLVFKVLNSDLAGRGQPYAALWVYTIALIINICLNLWLIPRYGAVGSAWASSASYFFGALIFAVMYAKMSSLSITSLFLPSRVDFRRLYLAVSNNA